MSFSRRYAPFLVLAALQILIVVALPSKGPERVTAGGFALGESTTAPGGGLVPGTDGGTVTTDGSSLPGSGTSTGGAGTRSGGSDSGGSGGPGGDGRPAGDTTHCTADGRQFGESYYAPPCVPKWGGGNNGGSTYLGVTDTEVKIVRVMFPDPAVDGVLATQGLATTVDEEKEYYAAAERFINDNYELYGRQVRIKVVTSDCSTQPADVPCLRNLAREVIATEKPFIVLYQSALAPELFDEFARGGVITWGGWHFDDAFNVARRPFHYDLPMGGTQSSEMFADYWCKKLAGKNARYAGDPLLASRPRVAGILIPDAEVNLVTANQLKDLITGGKCGKPGDAFVYPYESNISRAQEQTRAVLAKMAADKVNSIVVYTDPVAPAFFSRGATGQGFFPEYVLVGVGFTDYDLVGRLYAPEQWRNAFGVSHIYPQPPMQQSEAYAVYKGGGGQQDRVHALAALAWGYLHQMMAPVQMAGPTLNPGTYEQAALTSEPRGGWARTQRADLALVKYGPNDYTSLSDAREVYWDNQAVSSVDGRPGAYVALNGGARYEIGQWPPGEPQLPGR